jgi:Tol biopolymer transport system component
MSISVVVLVLAGRLAAGGEGSLHPSWSPDGRWIAFQSDRDGDHEIYVVRADGTGLRQLTHDDGEDAMPRWSADGTRLRFMKMAAGEHAFFEVDLNGGTPRRASGSHAPEPVKSRDGRMLAWEAPDGATTAHGGPTVILVRPAAGGASRRVSGPGHSEQPGFSPDGTSIVYENRLAGEELVDSRLYLVPTSGGAPRLLTKGTDPSWSPDGRRILFKAWLPDRKQLSVSTIAPDGSGLRHLAPGVHPSWSPDGARILYMSDVGGRFEIHTMSASGGGRRCLSCRAPN